MRGMETATEGSSGIAWTHSPSSVRWHSDAMLHMHHHYDKNSADWAWQDAESPRNENELSEAWKTPDEAEMHRRLQFRRTIREETLQHRRIHRHGGIVAARNIAQVLRDRECFGAHKYTHSTASRAVASSGTTKGTAPSPKSTSASASAPLSTSTGMLASSSPPVAGKTQPMAIPTLRGKRNLWPFPGTITNEVRTFAEYYSVVRYHSAFLHHLGGNDEIVNGQRPSSSQAVSTISVAFSPDAKTMASTHGDHTVKITSTCSGHLLQTLDGHPRTPWTVKYHPTDPQILASGCLGHQVRLWNWTTATCLHMIRLEFAIISLSFHPQGSVLAIANGTRLHFWSLDGLLDTEQPSNQQGKSQGVDQAQESSTVSGAPASTAPPAAAQQQQQQRRGILTEVEQRHMLRCVHFHPDGTSLIVGGVNSTPERSRRVGSMTFYLRLFDFDLNLALRPEDTTTGGYRRRVISNPRTFIPRALLYNDGGFDISPDGKTVCACAEYWLPDGVENAMDLLYPTTNDHADDNREGDSSDDETMQEETNMTMTCQPLHSSTVNPNDEANKSSDPLQNQQQTPGTSNLSAAATNTHSPPRSGSHPPIHPGPSTTAQTSSFTQLVASRGNPMTPQTPPPSVIRSQLTLSPPSPPGRRFAGGLARVNLEQDAQPITALPVPPNDPNEDNISDMATVVARNTFIPPPPPAMQYNRGSHDTFSMMTRILDGSNSTSGRFVPHVVTISLDTSPIDNDTIRASSSTPGPPLRVSKHTRPRLGQLLEACPLDGAKASAVTCVKFSPSTNFCLIGYGVREPLVEHNGHQYHPVTALYRVRGGMTHVSTMLSSDDDVNIARFHPESGYGFVYGTKQGRVRVLSPRPWNFYNC